MQFLVRLGYGVAGLGFAWLAVADLTKTYPFQAYAPSDPGEAIRFALVLAVNAAIMLVFAFNPGVWARLIAPVLAASWVFLGYMLWSIARSMTELISTVIVAPLGGQAAAEASTPPLLLIVLGLAASAFTAAVLDWIRCGVVALSRPKRPAAA